MVWQEHARKSEVTCFCAGVLASVWEPPEEKRVLSQGNSRSETQSSKRNMEAEMG